MPAGAAPFQRRERRGRPRKETKIEPSEDGFDVGEYDLAEEEEKEANLWSSILGEGKLMKAEKVEDQVKSVKNKTGKSIIDHAKRLVEALISHPLYAHYAEPTTRLKNYTNVVKTPMDLEIVMKRLLGGYYSTRYGACSKDTLFHNCYASYLAILLLPWIYLPGMWI